MVFQSNDSYGPGAPVDGTGRDHDNKSGLAKAMLRFISATFVPKLSPSEADKFMVLYRVLRMVCGSRLSLGDFQVPPRQELNNPDSNSKWWQQAQHLGTLLSTVTNGQITPVIGQAFAANAVTAVRALFDSLSHERHTDTDATQPEGGHGDGADSDGANSDGANTDGAIGGGHHDAHAAEHKGEPYEDGLEDEWLMSAPLLRQRVVHAKPPPLTASTEHITFAGGLAKWLVHYAYESGNDVDVDLGFEEVLLKHPVCSVLPMRARIAVWMRALFSASPTLQQLYQRAQQPLLHDVPASGCDAQCAQPLTYFAQPPTSGDPCYLCVRVEDTTEAMAQVHGARELDYQVLAADPSFPDSVETLIKLAINYFQPLKLCLIMTPSRLYATPVLTAQPLHVRHQFAACKRFQVLVLDQHARSARDWCP